MTAAETYELDEPYDVFFQPALGPPIEVGLVRIDVVGGSVEIIGVMQVSDVQRAVDAGGFHLEDATVPEAWDLDRPTRVVLVLRRHIGPTFSNGDAVVEALFGTTPTILHAADSWWGVEITQTVVDPEGPEASIEIGIRTPWIDRRF